MTTNSWGYRLRDDSRDVIYRERANGRDEYFMYSDGRRVQISEQTAMRDVQRRLARIIDI